MPEKELCVLHTGGTIGMEMTARGYAPMKDFAAQLPSLLRRRCPDHPRFALHAFDAPIDSTNATPADWCRIGREIAARYDDYAGFVVLHGTDTMAYTAAALSFMLQGLGKPVVLTGAQIPMGEANTDGLQNMADAMASAARDDISEVVICFGRRLLRGNRSTKVSATRLDAFDSPNYPALADIGAAMRINPAALLPRAGRPNFELPEYGSGEVLAIRLVPGLSGSAVQAAVNLHPKAIILQGYGTGNVPDRDPALTQALIEAGRQGAVLVLCSQSAHATVRQHAYATGAALASANVIGAIDMTFEAVFAKLHHLFALGPDAGTVRARLVKNLSGELTE